jgi:drug/metabolite transporter (DMT)-like permease
MIWRISLRARTLVMVALMVLFTSSGDVLLSKGMKQIGAVNIASAGALAHAFAGILANGAIWFGVLALILSMICYMVTLSWADYSFVQPAAAIGYAVVPFLGYLLLGESVTSLRWAGVLCICTGVLLITRTDPRTTLPVTEEQVIVEWHP